MMLYIPYDDEYRQCLSTNEVHEYRKDILLRWLYEFQFTDYATAFKLVGLDKSKGGYRFIKKLIDAGYLVRFHNVQLGNSVNFLALTLKSKKELKNIPGVAENKSYKNLKRLKNNSNMIHDLGTQKSVMALLKECTNEIYDYAFKWEVKEKDIRVDAMIYAKKKADHIEFLNALGIKETNVIMKAAIEYERTAKSSRRIFFAFKNHDRNINTGLYNGVYYYFSDLAIKNMYEKKLNQSAWTNSKMNKSHQLEKLSSCYTPQARQMFDLGLIRD